MSQDLQERLRLVEQSARRWKRLALGSWALLALLLLLCAGLTISQVTAMRAMTEQQALRAQQAEEEAARLRQEQARALERSERLLYQAQINLAQREWKDRQNPPPAKKR